MYGSFAIVFEHTGLGFSFRRSARCSPALRSIAPRHPTLRNSNDLPLSITPSSFAVKDLRHLCVANLPGAQYYNARSVIAMRSVFWLQTPRDVFFPRVTLGNDPDAPRARRWRCG